MRLKLEALSTWVFRIAALSVLSFAALQTLREQSRPVNVDVEDAKLIGKMEEFVKREKACQSEFQLTANRRSLQTVQCSLK